MTHASTALANPSGRHAAIDYLIVGHVTIDLIPDGQRLGGTASYAGMAACAMGLRVGLVTACQASLDLSLLQGMAIQRRHAAATTTFRNLDQGGARRQILSARSDDLDLDLIPPAWRGAPIVHLAPVADEIPRDLARSFPGSFVGVTPQGWWRTWDDSGHVLGVQVEQALERLGPAQAAAFSQWDLALEEMDFERVGAIYPIMAVTAGEAGSDVYWNGQHQHVPAPLTACVDDVGAGDIFAAAFFVHLERGRSAVEAAEEATRWAAASVQRPGVSWLRDAQVTGISTGADTV